MINIYCTDSLTIRRNTYGTWGGVASYTDVAVKGRFEFKTRMVRNIKGEQVVSSANVYLPMMIIAHKDKIIYNSIEYSILSIEVKKDFSERYILVNLA